MGRQISFSFAGCGLSLLSDQEFDQEFDQESDQESDHDEAAKN